MKALSQIAIAILVSVNGNKKKNLFKKRGVFLKPFFSLFQTKKCTKYIVRHVKYFFTILFQCVITIKPRLICMELVQKPESVDPFCEKLEKISLTPEEMDEQIIRASFLLATAKKKKGMASFVAW